MPFIDINNLTAIRALAPGNFAIPKMVVDPNPLLVDTARLRKSIKAMKTIMTNSGFGQVAALIQNTQNGLLSQQMDDLENNIVADMTAYLLHPGQAPLAQLTQIFHKVQLWGGRAGRNIYIMNGGFLKNWNAGGYQKFVAASATHYNGQRPDPRVALLMGAAGQINQFGVAFATKHARFWAQAANVEPLLIYDSIMARGCFGKKANWKDYDAYCAQMAVHAHLANTDVATLERFAFNMFGTTAGAKWLAARQKPGKAIQETFDISQKPKTMTFNKIPIKLEQIALNIDKKKAVIKLMSSDRKGPKPEIWLNDQNGNTGELHERALRILGEDRLKARNIGAICRKHGCLDLKLNGRSPRFLIGEIGTYAIGGVGPVAFPTDPRHYLPPNFEATHCWAGNGYEGGLNFGAATLQPETLRLQKAVAYLKEFFEVRACGGNTQFDQAWVNAC